MEYKVIRIIIIIIVAILIAFAIYIGINAQTTVDENDKVVEEINYLDTKLLSLINYLNNIELQNYKVTVSKIEENTDSSSTNEEDDKESNQEEKEETTITKMEEATIVNGDEDIDWETIIGELEILYSAWPTIILDLYKIDTDSDMILKFSDRLDDVIISVKEQDKSSTAMYLASLYGYLPMLLENSSADTIAKNILQIKSYTVSAYAYVETDNWQKVEEEISKGEEILNNIMSDVSIAGDNREFNINKAYVLIEELKNSLSTEDKEIFYIKYKNLMEELNIIA